MTETLCQRMIPDQMIEIVHANANFGSMAKRDVVDEGVLKYAFGYSTGHTQKQILLEHGLIIRTSRNRVGELSAKGKKYFRAMFRGTTMAELLTLRKD